MAKKMIAAICIQPTKISLFSSCRRIARTTRSGGRRINAGPKMASESRFQDTLTRTVFSCSKLSISARPAVGKHPRGGLHELLAVSGEPLAVFNRHFHPLGHPLLAGFGGLRKRARSRQLGAKFGSKVRLCRRAAEPALVHLRKRVKPVLLHLD